jgi:hypothetical protein
MQKIWTSREESHGLLSHSITIKIKIKITHLVHLGTHSHISSLHLELFDLLRLD